MNTYYTYILTNKKKGVLYIGVTNNLIKRTYIHKKKIAGGFTQKYNVNKLVYYEKFNSIISAITREKQLKNWKRTWKIELIEKHNIEWKDLYREIM